MHAVAAKFAEAEAAQAAAMAAAHARAQALAPPSSVSSTNSSPTKAGPIAETPPPPAQLVTQKSRVRDFFGLSSEDKSVNKAEKSNKIVDKTLSPAQTSSSTAVDTSSSIPIQNEKTVPSTNISSATASSILNKPEVRIEPAPKAPSSVPAVVSSQHVSPTGPVPTQPNNITTTAAVSSPNSPVTNPQAKSVLLSPSTPPPTVNPVVTPKLSSAQQRLFQYIGDHGIAIIKHGKQNSLPLI